MFGFEVYERHRACFSNGSVIETSLVCYTAYHKQLSETVQTLDTAVTGAFNICRYVSSITYRNVLFCVHMYELIARFSGCFVLVVKGRIR
jgi:hypothetical protein